MTFMREAHLTLCGQLLPSAVGAVDTLLKWIFYVSDIDFSPSPLHH